MALPGGYVKTIKTAFFKLKMTYLYHNIAFTKNPFFPLIFFMKTTFFERDKFPLTRNDVFSKTVFFHVLNIAPRCEPDSAVHEVASFPMS